MSIYYIKAQVGGEDIQIALDSTTDINENNPGKLSSYLLEDGSEGSDNYVRGNTTLSFSGTLSDTKSFSSGFQVRNEESDRIEDSAQDTLVQSDGSLRYRTSEQNKTRLERLRNEGIAFEVHTTRRVFRDCYFLDLNFRQTNRRGTLGDVAAYLVSFTAKQTRRGARARVVVVRDSEAVKSYQAKIESGGNKVAPSPEKQLNLDTLLSDNILSVL